MNVSILGAGYVGLVTGLCLADRGHRVTLVDIDAAKIAGLAKGFLPIHEDGLKPLLDKHLGHRFFPVTDTPAAVRESDLTMITVGTPTVNGQISLDFVEAAAATIGRALAGKQEYHVVVVKSTVVPGTTEGCVRRALEQNSGKICGPQIGLGMNPEFLREGEAVADFQHPDRLVIGGIDARACEAIARLYADFEDTPKILTNPQTAEMIKYASNALLATLISFSNEIGNLCASAADVDVVDVMTAVHLDKRISPVSPDGERITPAVTTYLRAGCGFGGSCFPKDVRALQSWAAANHQQPRVLEAVLATNRDQPDRLVQLLKKHVPQLAKRRIAVLGLAFKAGTDDIRESPALHVVKQLLNEGADVIAYDPIAASATRRVLGDKRVVYATALEDAIAGVDAILLLTAWPEFQRLPQLLDALQAPPVVVDGRRMLDKSRVRRYEGIGWSGEVRQPAHASVASV